MNDLRSRPARTEPAPTVADTLVGSLGSGAVRLFPRFAADHLCHFELPIHHAHLDTAARHLDIVADTTGVRCSRCSLVVPGQHVSTRLGLSTDRLVALHDDGVLGRGLLTLGSLARTVELSGALVAAPGPGAAYRLYLTGTMPGEGESTGRPRGFAGAPVMVRAALAP